MQITRRLAVITLLLTSPGRVEADQTDYLPDNLQWNGLSELASLARSHQLHIELIEELNWSSLPPGAALIVLYPLSNLSSRDVFSFLKQGGRLLLADDYGEGDDLLLAFGIQRHDSTTLLADRFHNKNLSLPLARSGSVHHPLNAGVSKVIANHPAYFTSPFPTLVGFESDQQLIVAAKVGKGRFIALSDPSILINAMLRFKGNMTLASNLLAYLCRDSSKQIFLVTGHVRIQGTPSIISDRPARPIQQFLSEYNSFLERISDFAATKPALHALAIGASSLCLVGLLLVLPLPRRDLKGHWTRPVHGHQRRRNEDLAAMALRDEMEEHLTELLDAPEPIFTIDPRWVVRRIREEFSEEAAQIYDHLMASMRHLPPALGPQQVAPPVRVHRRQLAVMIKNSNRLLDLIGSDRRNNRKEQQTCQPSRKIS